MKKGILVGLVAFFLTGLAGWTGTPRALGEATAAPARQLAEPCPRDECYTIDRSRPEWDPGGSSVDDPEEPDTAVAFRLLGNVPNPFSLRTTIRFSASSRAEVAAVRIYDLAGRTVRALEVSLSVPGVQQVDWDGRDWAGHRVPGGICFYRIQAGVERATGRMVLIQ